MGVLSNPQHERFCQELHKLVWAGGKKGEARTTAYKLVGYETNTAYVADNARRLANRPDIKARLGELAERSSKIAECDGGWAMVKLKAFAEANLDDYLSPPDSTGTRYFDISRVPRDKLALLSELTLEETVEEAGADGEPSRQLRRTRLKRHNPIEAIALMARIAGWAAPTKVAATDPTGEHQAPAPVQIIEIVRFAPDHPDGKDQAAA